MRCSAWSRSSPGNLDPGDLNGLDRCALVEFVEKSALLRETISDGGDDGAPCGARGPRQTKKLEALAAETRGDGHRPPTRSARRGADRCAARVPQRRTPDGTVKFQIERLQIEDFFRLRFLQTEDLGGSYVKASASLCSLDRLLCRPALKRPEQNNLVRQHVVALPSERLAPAAARQTRPVNRLWPATPAWLASA